MPCDICGSTIQQVAGSEGTQRTFWCQRCGSLTELTGDHRRVESSALVMRVKLALDRHKFTFDVANKPGGDYRAVQIGDMRTLAESVGRTLET